MQNSLFTEQVGFRPLAARMRPESLEDYVGQLHLVGPGKPLRRACLLYTSDAADE